MVCNITYVNFVSLSGLQMLIFSGFPLASTMDAKLKALNQSANRLSYFSQPVMEEYLLEDPDSDSMRNILIVPDRPQKTPLNPQTHTRACIHTCVREFAFPKLHLAQRRWFLIWKRGWQTRKMVNLFSFPCCLAILEGKRIHVANASKNSRMWKIHSCILDCLIDEINFSLLVVKSGGFISLKKGDFMTYLLVYFRSALSYIHTIICHHLEGWSWPADGKGLINNHFVLG